jgi:hypothetical protein
MHVLQVFEVTLMLFPYIFRLGFQSVFHASLGLINPIFDFRRSQVVLTASLRNSGFPLDDFEHQG